MSRRASSLNRVDSGMARELDTRYAHVKKVADNIEAVVKAASVDLEALADALNEATDFEGIIVVAGTTAAWDPVTKVLTVPAVKGDTGSSLTMTSVVANPDDTFTWAFSDGTEFTTPALRGAAGSKGNKGDKGDTGAALTMTSVTNNLGDTFTWHFSDGSSFTTPSLKGAKGDQGLKGERGQDVSVVDITYLGTGVFRWTFSDGFQYITPDLRGPVGLQGPEGRKGLKGDQGVSVHHLRATNTTQAEGSFARYGETDTFSFYGDAAETILLGHFQIRNGESVYQAAQKGGFVGTESELNNMLANIKASSDQVSLLAQQVQQSAAAVSANTATAVAAATAAEEYATTVQEALDAIPDLSVTWHEETWVVPQTTATLPVYATHVLVFVNGSIQTPANYTFIQTGEGLISSVVFNSSVTGDVKIQCFVHTAEITTPLTGAPTPPLDGSELSFKFTPYFAEPGFFTYPIYSSPHKSAFGYLGQKEPFVLTTNKPAAAALNKPLSLENSYFNFKCTVPLGAMAGVTITDAPASRNFVPVDSTKSYLSVLVVDSVYLNGTTGEYGVLINGKTLTGDYFDSYLTVPKNAEGYLELGVELAGGVMYLHAPVGTFNLDLGTFVTGKIELGTLLGGLAGTVLASVDYVDPAESGWWNGEDVVLDFKSTPTSPVYPLEAGTALWGFSDTPDSYVGITDQPAPPAPSEAFGIDADGVGQIMSITTFRVSPAGSAQLYFGLDPTEHRPIAVGKLSTGRYWATFEHPVAKYVPSFYIRSNDPSGTPINVYTNVTRVGTQFNVNWWTRSAIDHSLVDAEVLLTRLLSKVTTDVK